MPESKGAVVKASVISSIEKADASTQLDPKEERFASEWVEPDVDLRGLGEMVDNSAILPQCIRAYKNNIAGYGIGIKYINDDQEDTPEAQAEWEMLQNIVNLFTIEQDTKEIFEDIIEARETFGISYCEVIRDKDGNVIQLEFIRDTPSIRKSKPMEKTSTVYNYKGRKVLRQKRFCRYKQEINGKTVYFREFGDLREMDSRSGKFGKTQPEYRANELMEFPIGTDIYGKVRWIGQTLGCDGSRRAEHLNNNYFINGRHTPLLIAIKGGTLTDGSRSRLQAYMDGVRGAAGQHKFLILETEPTDTDFDVKQPEIEIKDLASILQKDELFQEYIENNRKRVQSAFNLPDLYVGYTRDFNRATAQTAVEITEKQVFQPERASLAWTINHRLLNSYELKFCEIEFKGPEMTNTDDLYKILTVAEKAGGLTPNKAKQVAASAMGETSEDYNGEWGNIPLAITQQQEAKEKAREREEQIKANLIYSKGINVDSQTLEDLDGQIGKAVKGGENDEVVAVMKAVRKVLLDIQKG